MTLYINTAEVIDQLQVPLQRFTQGMKQDGQNGRAKGIKIHHKKTYIN